MGDYGNLPVDIIFVRHGESEGNLAEEFSHAGDESYYEMPPFKAKHTSRYRLTKTGREQAKAAGDWLKANMPMGGQFDAYFCSEYIRARETAAYLDIPGAKWNVEFYLRERDQGHLSGTSQQERARNARIQYELSRRDLDWFYWAPAGGESISDCCLRCDRVLSHLNQTCQGLRVLIVSHGNIMVSFKIRLERMEQSRLRNIMDDPNEKIYNGHILHYSRRNPVTGEISGHIQWVRSICPWDTSKTDMSWRKIKPAMYTNEELLATVHEVPQVVERPGIEIPPEVNEPIIVPSKSPSTALARPNGGDATRLSNFSSILGPNTPKRDEEPESHNNAPKNIYE